MGDLAAVVEVQVTPPLVAAWLLRLMTHPVIEIGGKEYAATWGRSRVAVTPGTHRIAVFFRYRGQRNARLAEAGREFSTAEAPSVVRLTARLGPRNGSGFRFEDSRS
ncbi:hypothetical protein Stsp01_09190 [Streptomyces sp. NBRC 13847]|uniref:hypothetical protein n=1 Tax=Streptomyces TaxID=1883 RepID=UPI0024A5A510|nr:hypothetical protein [Streptomyces sp. NBRC 13847]GLW14176.1 hypothetical protein Stsp01_09190 [Streptomyces sp. NBRC 13847]